jgi:transposase
MLFSSIDNWHLIIGKETIMEHRNVARSTKNSKREEAQLADYDHYIAIDWSEQTMAIARMTKTQKLPIVQEQPTNLKEMKFYLHQLRGSKVLCVEETTTAHWLYLELCEYVDHIVICDPYRNRLLADGPKTDKIDASKLCVLLKAGLLKPVFHSHAKDFELRKLISAYTDVIQAGVRFKNQRSALYRAEGKDRAETIETTTLKFILDLNQANIDLYEQTKAEYVSQFERLCKTDKRIQQQCTIPGIGIIGAVKIVAIVVDANRFEHASKYLSYCGLVMLPKLSGGRSYGQRRPRCERELKAVYKTAALSAISGEGPFHEYYESLRTKGLAEHDARNAVARLIAKISYGMLKNGTSFKPFLWKDRMRSATKKSA